MNIGGYVDRFEGEGEIDLDGIGKEVEGLEEESEKRDGMIADLWKEVGIV